MCERYSPLRPLRVLRRIALTASVAAACSTEATPAPGANDVSAADTVTTTDGTMDSPDDGVVGAHPGDPIAAGAPTVVGRAVGLATLTQASGALYTSREREIVRLAAAGPELVATLDAPALALTAQGDTLYAVDSAGAWYRVPLAGEPQKLEAGLVVQRLAVDGDRLVAALGAAGVAVAPLDLSIAPVTVSALGAVRAVLPLEDGLRVLARGQDGFALVKGSWPDAVVVSEVPTKLPASAVARGADGLVVGLEAGGSLHTLVFEGETLTSVGLTPYPGPGLALAIAGSLAVTADWDRVVLYDVSNTAAPRRLASEHFGQRRAFDLVALDATHVSVRNAAEVTELALDATAVAPELALTPQRIQVEATADFDGGSAGVLFRNKGALPLEVRGLTVDHPRLSLDLDTSAALSVAADDVAFLELKVTGAEPLEGTLSFSTNEPGEPSYSLPVTVNPKRLSVGDVATPFSMPGTDGELVSLGDLMGRVIHVKLFNAY